MLIMTVTNSDKSSVSVAIRFLLKVTKRTFQQKVHSSLTLRCRINWESQNKPRGWRSLLNLIIGGRGFDISIYSLISVMNEKKRHKCLILMLNLKVSKESRSEASKDKIIIKKVSNISIN